MIQEKVKKNMYFPIFKTSEKSYVDTFTNEDTKITELVCSDCSHRFSSKERYVNNVVCPNCGNKELNYSPISAPEIDDSLVFSKDVEILLHTGDRGDIRHMHKVHFTDKSAISSRDAFCIREPMVLDTQVIDGETFYIVREFEMYLNLDKDTGKKTLHLFHTYNSIIFGQNEIVNIKDGKKSSAMFENSFGSWYSFHRKGRCFVADEDVLKDFITYVYDYKIKSIIPDIVCDTEIPDIYCLKLNELDNIVASIKDAKPVSSVTLKRQELIKSILDRKPSPMPFNMENDKVCYNVVEVDELTNTMTFEYICPHCEEISTEKMSKRYYHTTDDEYIACPRCGALTFRKDLVDIRYLEGSTRTVTVIQNFGDGIIIYDASYSVAVKGTNLELTPEISSANEICVISKDFNPDNIMSSVTILRQDYDTGKYSLAKTLKIGCGRTHTPYIRNEATNFNVNWSGVERLNDHLCGGNYADIDMITAYALLYRKYPVMEKCMKEGQCVIAKNILSGFDWSTSTPNEKYDLEQSDVASALRMSKGCLRILKKEKKDFIDAFTKLQLLYSVDHNLCEEDYNYICEQSISVYKIAEICREFGFSVHDVCGYLERVRVAQCVNPYTAVSEWLDYLVASRVIGCDLADKRVKYPSALRTEHDKVVYKKNIIENEEFEEKFQKVVGEYGKKFAYKGKDFVMTYPKTISDLFEEGRMLNHCVGSYGDAIKSGNSIVLFIRKKKEMDTPYFTLEVDPAHNAVTQIGGYSDVAPHHIRNKELIEFIKEWADKNEVVYSTK